MNQQQLYPLAVVITLIIIASNSLSANAECSAQEKYSPCMCVDHGHGSTGREIICTNINEPIGPMFKRMGDLLGNDTQYTMMSIKNNHNVVELPANVFGKLKFEALLINCSQIQRIHRYALASTELIYIMINNTPIVDSDESGYNFFEALRATTTLISIQISGSKLTKVSHDAFRSHPNIANIDMANNPIAAIEPHAFDNTTMLQYIVFSNDHLATLPAEAFNVGEVKYREIEVHLEGNNLNKVTLTGATFAHINGYSNLYLYNNGFQYLNETVFTPFLLNRPHNKIYSDTECKHKGNDWLREKYPISWIDKNC